MDVVGDARRPPGDPSTTIHFGEFFDALVLLHRGQAAEAVALLDGLAGGVPSTTTTACGGAWYASAWAEAAVLADLPDAADRVARARSLTTAGNPSSRPSCAARPACCAAARRAAPTSRPRPRRSTRSARRYQWARTLVMLGGDDRERGEQELAALGASPMPWPR